MSDWGGRIELEDEAAVLALASRCARVLQAPMVIYLSGDLGAGKTTFARALIQSMGYPGRVKSPSYGLLESYQIAGVQVLHLDLYRIEHAAELEYLALADQFDNKSILLVEWPGKGAGFLPAPDLELHLDELGEGRVMQLKAHTAAAARLVRQCLSNT